MIDANTKLKIVELRARDYSIKRIADELGIAKQTVVDALQDMKEQVATLRAINLDELYESQAITAEARIRNLSSLTQRIKEELDGRDLTDVPTDKLIDLYIKTASALEERIIEPVFQSSQEQEEDREARKILDSI